MMLQSLGPIASTSLFSVNWHQCLTHVVEQALMNYTPLKLFDEGLMEANLRIVEKANWALCSRRLADEADAAMKLAKLHAISQGTYLQVYYTVVIDTLSVQIRTILATVANLVMLAMLSW